MVLELLHALQVNREFNPMGGFEDAVQLMEGIQNGFFFDLPKDVQCNKLLKINASFFGRGERAIPLFAAGLLPNDFDTEFQLLYRQYRDSDGSSVL
jgi:hypothetical protein